MLKRYLACTLALVSLAAISRELLPPSDFSGMRKTVIMECTTTTGVHYRNVEYLARHGRKDTITVISVNGKKFYQGHLEFSADPPKKYFYLKKGGVWTRYDEMTPAVQSRMQEVFAHELQARDKDTQDRISCRDDHIRKK